MTSDSVSSYGSDLGAAVDPDGDEVSGGRPVRRGSVDTVEDAITDPDLEQPWQGLGLEEDQYHRIREILGRRPTSCELAMYGVLWGERGSRTSSAGRLSPAGGNVGVVDVGGGRAVAVCVESHHPGDGDPSRGAATAVGRVVHAVLATGARPIAVLDALRFGALDDPDTARLVPDVVAGVGGSAHRLGLPTIGGEVVFDPCYRGGPLVDVLCVGTLRRDVGTLRRDVGTLRRDDGRLAGASGKGNLVVLIGPRPGDAAGGDGDARPPGARVGDPVPATALVECCLELFAAGIVTGIRDVGAAGLSGALSELAGDGGMVAHLDRVAPGDPDGRDADRRDPDRRTFDLRPEEILRSGSSERMTAVVRPDDLTTLLTITTRWDVEATVVGEVTDPGRLIVRWHGETVVDVPTGSPAPPGPVPGRAGRRPHGQDAIVSEVPDHLARPATGDELRATLLRLAGSPNLSSRAWVTDRYDRYDRHVGGDPALAPPDGVGVVRIDEESGLGIALATEGSGRFGLLDPATGARLALATAHRHVATGGAAPIAVTACLTVGSPADPGVRWQFEQAATGLTDGCRTLGLPVVAADVFLDHRTGPPADRPVADRPTMVVGVLGVTDDVARRTPAGWRSGGLSLHLLGTTREELAGSEWAWVVHRHLGGHPPAVDLAAEQRLGRVLLTAARTGLVSAAHDLSAGGLAQAVVEASLRHGVGARVSLAAVCARDGVSPFLALFAESTARVLVALDPAAEEAFTRLCADGGVPVARLGVTDATSGALEIVDQLTVPLAELRAAHEAPLPAVLGA